MSSPFFEETEVTGGDIKTIEVKYVWYIICVILVIWLLFVLFKKIRINGEDYNQRKALHHFQNISGEAYTEDAKLQIEYTDLIDNPRAIDHYRAGTTLLLNAKNPDAAHRHFSAALNQIIEGHVPTREVPFILDRIYDFNELFVDFPHIEDLPLQRARMAYYEQQAQQLKEVKRMKPAISKDDPEIVQKTILACQTWDSDSQNVHDSYVYRELVDQFNRVRNANAKIPDIQLHTYEEAVNWLRVKYRGTPNATKLEEVLAKVSENNTVGIIPTATERDLITTIWQRSYDPSNADNAENIRKALGEALCDCVESDHLVCMTGRVSKTWQALARIDSDPQLGVFKTKQAIRNEIYERAAKIVDDYIGEKGSVSNELKEAYNRGETSEQVQELIECMHKAIDGIKTEYANLPTDENLDSIITECKAVV